MSEHHRVRHIVVPVLIVVASLLAVLSATSVWVRRQALDTDAWVNASSDMLANKDVQKPAMDGQPATDLPKIEGQPPKG